MGEAQQYSPQCVFTIVDLFLPLLKAPVVYLRLIQGRTAAAVVNFGEQVTLLHFNLAAAVQVHRP